MRVKPHIVCGFEQLWIVNAFLVGFLLSSCHIESDLNIKILDNFRQYS